MNRKEFLKSVAMLSLTTGTAMKLQALNDLSSNLNDTEEFPVLFVGHGSPMNAIETNRFSIEMREVGKKLTKPKAILMVSAHWETRGTFVTTQLQPETIHDFGGFPQELFDVKYPAPGSKWLAEETKATITKTNVGFDTSWGFDHGCWSVTKNMFPLADVPIIQLSLDYTKDPQYHYDLARQLASLRKKGVLIMGSGNMVHNLGMITLKNNDFNEPFGLDWALEANNKFKELIRDGDHQSLINYKSLGKAVQLAVPSPEHFLPLLYILALKTEKNKISYFNDAAMAGSLTMTSLFIS